MTSIYEVESDLGPTCKHDLMWVACDHTSCRLKAGLIQKAPYRKVLQEAGFKTPEVESRRDCQLCGKRSAKNGNRLYAKLPRPPRGAFGTDVPTYAPSYAGPVIEAPRVYASTHRMRNGRYACDRCDPSWCVDPQPFVSKQDEERNKRAGVIRGKSIYV